MADTLRAGESLTPGMELVSNNGQYRVVMQGDGNLVLYEANGAPVWATDTWNLPGFQRPVTAEMQADGNFVLYSVIRWPAWDTGTWGKNGDRIVIQNDRNFVLYSADGAALWSTGTWIPTPTPTPTPTPGLPVWAPPQVEVTRRLRNEVGWGKFMTTDATLYRDGRLICSVRTENNNWTGGLRGRVLIVGVDPLGRACWVSHELSCTTRCSIPDFSCASFGTDTLVETWPPEAARLVGRLDIYQADAASFVDLRQQLVVAIQSIGELVQLLGPVLALL